MVKLRAGAVVHSQLPMSNQICNYEGSAYRTEFWGQNREYEDAAERIALGRMLPPQGCRLIDIGGGYGRLTALYGGYDQVVIFDYAVSQLRQAQALWGEGGRDGHPIYTYVAGDYYRLPFAPGVFDTVVMVRALHHAANPAMVLQGLSDILLPGGTLLLEFANKRNLKAILRYLAGHQSWSPFDREAFEFVPLNFDFHPAWIQDRLVQAGFSVRQRRAVSSFRVPLLKRLLPTSLLVALDRLCQPLGGVLPLSPSVFVRCTARRRGLSPPPGDLLRCTMCGSVDLIDTECAVRCAVCGASFGKHDGAYDFRAAKGESGNE
ncbi:MAG: class I SAM-dependent methyltransferase [Anaerolineae bacterium]